MGRHKEFKAEVKLLHDNIKIGDLAAVESFIEKYPREKFLYNDRKASAAATALKSNRIEIYAALVAVGLSLGPHEDINEIMSTLPKETRRKLRDIHKVYVKNPNVAHVASLVAKSKIAHDNSELDRRKLLELIAKAFEELNEIEWVAPMLKIIANSEDLNIIFDFNRDSIEHMDPTNNQTAKGICYFGKGDVYIGAKGLLKERHRFRPSGVMAHELAHYAMNLLYRNKCKPYHKQSGSQQEFDGILKTCNELKHDEDQIAYVFLYPDEQRHAELIVRVPHLMALYKEEPRRLDEVKATFGELFQFYERNILVDLQLQLPLMEVKHKIKELNELSGLLESLKGSEISFDLNSFHFEFDPSRITVVSSNCPQLSMHVIYQKLVKSDSSHVFVKLETLRSEKIKNLLVESLAACPEMVVIIDCCEQKDFSVIFDKLFDDNLKQRIILVGNAEVLGSENIFVIKVNHCWSQLTIETQENLLKLPVNFQGVEMPFYDLLAVDSDVLQSISLSDLIEGKLAIGKALKFDEVNFHIVRKFITLGDEPREHDIDGILASNVLLCDEPGTGKSTVFKVASIKLKEKFPTAWVVLVNLKEHSASFNRNEEMPKRFNHGVKVAEYFCEHILKVEGWEAEVFKHFYSKGQVVLMLDSYDEISEPFREFCSKLFKEISRKLSNQLWVATRSHLKVLSRCNLGIDSLSCYKLKPFTKDDRSEFIRQHFGSNFSMVKLKEIENFLSQLETIAWPINSILSPLILRMILEILEGEPKIRLKKINLYSIYELFVEKMIEKYVKKGSETENELAAFIVSVVDVIAFHQEIAFDVIFGSSDNDLSRLIASNFNNSSLVPFNQISNIGSVSMIGPYQLQFVHRTIAEFLVVKFFVEKFFLVGSDACQNQIVSGNVLALLVKVWNHPSNSSMMLKFHDSAAENFNQSPTFKSNFAKLFAFQELKTFHKLIREGCTNLVELSVNCVDGIKKLGKKV